MKGQDIAIIGGVGLLGFMAWDFYNRNRDTITEPVSAISDAITTTGEAVSSIVKPLGDLTADIVSAPKNIYEKADSVAADLGTATGNVIGDIIGDLIVGVKNLFSSKKNTSPTPTSSGITDWSWAMSKPASLNIAEVEMAQKQTSQAINQVSKTLAEAKATGSDKVQLTPTISAPVSAVESGKVVLVKATGTEEWGSYAQRADAEIKKQATEKGIDIVGKSQSQIISETNKAVAASNKANYVKGSATAEHKAKLAKL